MNEFKKEAIKYLNKYFGGGGTKWHEKDTEVRMLSNLLKRKANRLDALVRKKIAGTKRFSLNSLKLNGYWWIEDKTDEDKTIWIDCSEEFIHKIVETLNSNFTA